MAFRSAVAVAVAAVLTATTAWGGDIFVGQWNGLVPASIEILDDQTLRFCQEDLVLQCQGPVPYSREGETLVVEHFANGLKWTYRSRPDGGYDATYSRWDGNGAYTPLATAVLRLR